MTTYGHIMTMKTKIAEFKAQLSYYLKIVRSGREVTVMDRETPIARVVPYHAGRDQKLSIHPAARTPKNLAHLHIPPAKNVDSLAMLQDMRRDDLEAL